MNKTLFVICLLLLTGTIILQGQTLRSLADARGIYFGAAVTFPASPAIYDTTLVREFNGVVCENAMKFGNIMTGPSTLTFTAADAIVNFGVSHGMYVRGHTFIWHKQVPTWFANLTISRDSAFKIMNYYITTEMVHYKGKIKEWDIVNEAVARDSSGMRLGSGYADASQNSKWAALTDAVNNNFDYIDSAFTYARRADSSVLLFYNDYNCEGMGRKSNQVYDLVARLKKLNLIDGIGLQCHFHLIADTGVGGAWSPSEMATNLERLTALGLLISFTEVDIRIPNPRTPMTAADSANLIEQRREYNTLMNLFLAHPNCLSFFTWGVNDNQSWVPGFFTGYGSALLFSNTAGPNGEYVPKQPWYGVRDALLPPAGILKPDAVVRRGIPVDAGNGIYDLLGRRISPVQNPPHPRRFQVKPGAIE